MLVDGNYRVFWDPIWVVLDPDSAKKGYFRPQRALLRPLGAPIPDQIVW